MEFQLGGTYSGYEFLDIVKRSRTGIEYRVRNTRVGRIELLRSLPETAQDDADRSARFLREMRVHAGLLHPNIVTLFAASELENHLIMTTELVEGPTLADKLSLGAFRWQDSVTLMRQLLSALTYAHREGIVHRDISPENIVVTPEGVLKLANFAMAKNASSPKLTTTGLSAGNVKYISPEQVRGVDEVDSRADIYAAGMVLYEMLCGRPAFVAESQFEVMTAQVVQAPAPPHQVNPAVPAALSAVVLKALAKEPAGRYQTADAFDIGLIELCEAVRSAQLAAQSAGPQLAGLRNIETQAAPAGAATAVLVAEPVSRPAAAPVLAPAMSMMPAVVPMEAKPVMSRPKLLIGVAAGAGMGILLVTLWLVAK